MYKIVPEHRLDRYNPDALGPDPHARALWRMLQNEAQTRPRGQGKALLFPIQEKDEP